MTTTYPTTRERVRQHPLWTDFVSRADFLASTRTPVEAAALALVSNLDHWLMNRSPELAAGLSLAFVIAYSDCSWNEAVDALKAATNQRRQKEQDGKRRRP